MKHWQLPSLPQWRGVGGEATICQSPHYMATEEVTFYITTTKVAVNYFRNVVFGHELAGGNNHMLV